MLLYFYEVVYQYLSHQGNGPVLLVAKFSTISLETSDIKKSCKNEVIAASKHS